MPNTDSATADESSPVVPINEAPSMRSTMRDIGTLLAQLDQYYHQQTSPQDSSDVSDALTEPVSSLALCPSRHEFLRDFVEPHQVAEDEHCAICLEEYSDTHSPVRFTHLMSCDHVFGKECITIWLSQVRSCSCPICRTQLFELPLEERLDIDPQDLERLLNALDNMVELANEAHLLLTGTALGEDLYESDNDAGDEESDGEGGSEGSEDQDSSEHDSGDEDSNCDESDDQTSD